MPLGTLAGKLLVKAGKLCLGCCSIFGGGGGSCSCWTRSIASWDCGAKAWHVTELLSQCVSDVDAAAAGFTVHDWAPTADPCSYDKVSKGPSCTCGEACSGADPGLPLGGSAPPDCPDCDTPPDCHCPEDVCQTIHIEMDATVTSYDSADGSCGGAVVHSASGHVAFDLPSANTLDCGYNNADAATTLNSLTINGETYNPDDPQSLHDDRADWLIWLYFISMLDNATGTTTLLLQIIDGACCWILDMVGGDGPELYSMKCCGIEPETTEHCQLEDVENCQTVGVLKDMKIQASNIEVTCDDGI